ncbi:MAG: RsmE family RNA methyltransferase [Tissierellia bacterium]|nr:RsmE family RNA methyltransferase [Tissierellia bacterium]MDD4725535.1 RsmE family RNA methyltransferase [Tissierellia bacterium]
MHRFFVEKSQIEVDRINIINNDVKHIKDVLRLKIGEYIEISCEGITYLCEIEQILKDKVSTLIKQKEIGNHESKVEISLFQGLAKGNRMELIFQKGTEVGIKNFYPVITYRSVVKINDIKKEQNKVSRWNSIVEEAAKQSKRDIIPKVNGIIGFDDMINILKDETNIIVPYEEEIVVTIREELLNIKDGRVNIVIGPEGGFEQSEIDKLKSIGGKIVTLGPRILRTETAGVVTATIVLYELGDLGVI